MKIWLPAVQLGKAHLQIPELQLPLVILLPAGHLLHSKVRYVLYSLKNSSSFSISIRNESRKKRQDCEVDSPCRNGAGDRHPWAVAQESVGQAVMQRVLVNATPRGFLSSVDRQIHARACERAARAAFFGLSRGVDMRFTRWGVPQ